MKTFARVLAIAIIMAHLCFLIQTAHINGATENENSPQSDSSTSEHHRLRRSAQLESIQNTVQQYMQQLQTLGRIIQGQLEIALANFTEALAARNLTEGLALLNLNPISNDDYNTTEV